MVYRTLVALGLAVTMITEPVLALAQERPEPSLPAELQVVQDVGNGLSNVDDVKDATEYSLKGIERVTRPSFPSRQVRRAAARQWAKRGIPLAVRISTSAGKAAAAFGRINPIFNAIFAGADAAVAYTTIRDPNASTPEKWRTGLTAVASGVALAAVVGGLAVVAFPAVAAAGAAVGITAGVLATVATVAGAASFIGSVLPIAAGAFDWLTGSKTSGWFAPTNRSTGSQVARGDTTVVTAPLPRRPPTIGPANSGSGGPSVGISR